MTTTAAVSELIALKNILYLTDFSEPSEQAVPFAVGIARQFGASVYSLHVLLPEPYTYTTPLMSVEALEAEEENARSGMQRVRAQFAGLPHEAIVERGLGIWEAVEQLIRSHKVDLIVMGTHGRTGASRLLWGSVAEEVFRRSPVPVLTIGPGVRTLPHGGVRFRRVLFASDFTPASLTAGPYAVSMAKHNDAHLVLLHVVPMSEQDKDEKEFEDSVAHVIQRLYDVVPQDVNLAAPAEVVVEYGQAAERIVEVAKNRNADLIVLGIRGVARHLAAATHVEQTVVHQVSSQAPCPVLTVQS